MCAWNGSCLHGCRCRMPILSWVVLDGGTSLVQSVIGTFISDVPLAKAKRGCVQEFLWCGSSFTTKSTIGPRAPWEAVSQSCFQQFGSVTRCFWKILTRTTMVMNILASV